VQVCVQVCVCVCVYVCVLNEQYSQSSLPSVSAQCSVLVGAPPHLCVRQVVHHAPRRAHDDVRPLGQRDGLRHHIDAAHQHGAADANQGAHRFHLLRNLDGQLTGGGQHERIQLLWLVHQALQDGQAEGTRFA